MWTAQDTAYAVALTRLDQRTCTGCGQDRAESTDAATEFSWHAEAVRCHACAARQRAADQYDAAGGSSAGLLFAVARNDDEEVAGDG